MVNKMQNDTHGRVVFALLVMLLASLFISRALTSIFTGAFVLASLANKDLFHPLRNFGKDRLLLAVSILFLIPFISGLWSSDGSGWLSAIRVKLPLLLFPFAFAGQWQLASRKWEQLGYIFLLLCTAATLWSVADYLLHMNAIEEGYLRAKLIWTPFENDHIRFSWIIGFCVLLCLCLADSKRGRMRNALWLLVAWFVLYMHVLAARTGLACLYLILVLYFLRSIFRSRHKIKGLLALLLLAMLPALAWLLLPTFQNRIRYARYDLSLVTAKQYKPGSNDGARALSLKAGWNVITHHPFGVGAGDVFNHADTWYKANEPHMPQSDKLYPSSEWLMYGCAAGWPGIILFTIVLIYILLYRKMRNRFYWMVFQLTACFSFLLDIGLETQYGALLYALLTLWLWKWWHEGQPAHNKR